MLLNIPVPEELDEIALRLYFDAWKRAVAIVSNFEAVLPGWSLPGDDGSTSSEEWNEYLDQAQPELGAIAALVQQSAEIRLKSIICATSPYILLLKSDLRLNSPEFRGHPRVRFPAAVRTRRVTASRS